MIYFLDNSLQLQKIVTSKNVISAIHEHELNGLIRADVELDLSYANKFLILGIDHVGYYYKDEFYLHKIQRVEYDHVNETATVVLRHIFFEDMIFGKLIQDVRPQNQDALQVSRQTIDANTRWQTIMTDVTGQLSTNFYWQVPYEVIEFMTENYRIDYLPKILFDGQKINGFQLHLANKIGEDKNIRIPYGSRVLELKYEEDYSEIITKLVVHGKGEEVGDGYGRRIDISNVNFNRNGVKSPVGSLYLEDESITNTYGNDGQTPREGREVFEDIENPNELAEAGYQRYLEVSRPQMLFTADVADIGDVGIGDSVVIIRREYDVYFNARIHKLSVDLLYPEDAQVELGDYKHFKESKVQRKTRESNKQYRRETSSRIRRLKEEFDERFDGEVNQMWEEYEQALIDVQAEIEADRANMTNLIEGTRSEFTDNLHTEISQAKDYAEQQAQAKADSVQSNLDSFKDTHSQIYDEVNGKIVDINTFLGDKSKTLKQQFDDIHTDFSTLENELSGIESDLSTTKNDLTTTKTDLQNQLDDARKSFDELEIGGRNLIPAFTSDKWTHQNLTEIEDYSLYFPSGQAGNSIIFLDVEPNTNYTMTFNSDYARYYIYEVLEDESLGKIIRTSTGSETYTFNTEDISRIRVSLNTFSGNVQEEKNIWNLKLEKGTVATDWTPAPEDTDNKITNINQTITNIEGELSTKVEQTEVDTLKGTVTAQGTLLTQTVGELSSKAEKSVVDTLTGRVSNTESSITQNSEEIAKRLLKSVYDENKQNTDAKITQWSNTASETAEGLERVIGRVSQTENGIETAQTRIEAEAGRINGLLSRTTEVEGQIQDARLSIEANADGIALRATKTEVEQAIDNIEVGARNLSTDTLERINASRNTGISSDNFNYVAYFTEEPIQSEKDYTISGFVEITDGDYNAVTVYEYPAGRRNDAELDENGYFSTTIRARGIDSDRFLIYNGISGETRGNGAIFRKVKVERGNKATDWTPAPEDTETKITKAQADIIANTNEIALKASQAELNSVTGEISSLAGQLSVQAGEISSVVSKVDGNTQNIAAVVQNTNSITSTIAQIENDLATQGSEIDQALDSITNKVWLGDVGGRNLLPQTVFPDSSNAWLNRGTNVTRHTTTTRGLTDYLWVNRADGEANRYIAILSPLLTEEVVEGHEYTIQFKTAHRVNVDDLFRYVYLMNEDGTPNQATPNASQNIIEIGENDYNGRPIQLHTITIKANFSGRARLLIGTYTVDSGAARFYVKEVKIEKGKATAYSRAPEDFLQMSELEITPGYWQLGSTRIDGNSISSVLRGTPDSIDAIVSEMNLTGNLNVKGQIETISLNAVNADIANLRTSILQSNVITADHLSVSTTMVNKLFSATARIDQLLTKTHFVNNIKAMSIDAVEANISSIRSKILTTDVILSGHINSSNALIDKIFADTARFERMMSKTGFVRTLNTVTIDTDQLTIRRPDGVAWVSNGVYKFNLEIQRNTFMDPSMTFNGQNYTVPDQYWRTFENAYTFHNGRYITAAFAVSLTSWTAPNSAYIHVRLREFGSGSLSKNFKVLARKGETSFHNLEIDLGKPDFDTAKNFYLEARMDENRSDVGGYVRVNRLVIRG